MNYKVKLKLGKGMTMYPHFMYYVKLHAKFKASRCKLYSEDESPIVLLLFRNLRYTSKAPFMHMDWAKGNLNIYD